MVLFYFSVIFLIKISTALHPNHLDFQKIGEVVLINQKYNILKPTIHKVTDYSKEFMLRKHSGNERTFLDVNGFRHSWSGFDGGSLRKANAKAVDEKEVTIISPAETGDKHDPAKTGDKNGLAKTGDNKNVVRTNDTTSTAKTEDKSSPAKEDTKLAGGGRTMAKVSFFCPFFGVINMKAFVD